MHVFRDGGFKMPFPILIRSFQLICQIDEHIQLVLTPTTHFCQKIGKMIHVHVHVHGFFPRRGEEAPPALVPKAIFEVRKNLTKEIHS